jgi:hypothetical protein
MFVIMFVMFVPEKDFQLSIMLMNKAGAYPKTLERCFTWELGRPQPYTQMFDS